MQSTLSGSELRFLCLCAKHFASRTTSGARVGILPCVFFFPCGTGTLIVKFLLLLTRLLAQSRTMPRVVSSWIAAVTGELLELKKLGLHPRPTESDSRDWIGLCFSKSSAHRHLRSIGVDGLKEEKKINFLHLTFYRWMLIYNKHFNENAVFCWQTMCFQISNILCKLTEFSGVS